MFLFKKDSCTISVPLSNPFEKDIVLEAFVDGQYLNGDSAIGIKSKSKTKYDLKFDPKRIGNFKGRYLLITKNFQAIIIKVLFYL
jgi:hypothetical protein